MVKNLPALQKIHVWSLGWKDALKKKTATHPSILAWEIPETRGARQTTVRGVTKRVRHDLVSKQQQRWHRPNFETDHLMASLVQLQLKLVNVCHYQSIFHPYLRTKLRLSNVLSSLALFCFWILSIESPSCCVQAWLSSESGISTSVTICELL